MSCDVPFPIALLPIYVNLSLTDYELLGVIRCNFDATTVADLKI